MHSRRAGSDHHPVDGEFADILFDQILSGVRAEITVIPGCLHSGKGAGETGKFMTINCGSDIGTTVTDIDTDFLFHKVTKGLKGSRIQVIKGEIFFLKTLEPMNPRILVPYF
jgi:hypothetical protein